MGKDTDRELEAGTWLESTQGWGLADVRFWTMNYLVWREMRKSNNRFHGASKGQFYGLVFQAI